MILFRQGNFAKTNSFYGLIISIKSMRKVNALNFSFGALNWTEQVKALWASFNGKLSFQSFFSMRNASLLKIKFSWYFNLWMNFHLNLNVENIWKSNNNIYLISCSNRTNIIYLKKCISFPYAFKIV